MAQGQYGHDFHPHPGQENSGNWEQQQGFNISNNQHIESMRQNHFQGSLQQYTITEGYIHSSMQQNNTVNMQQSNFLQQSNLRSNFHANMHQNSLSGNMQRMDSLGNIQQNNTLGNMNHINHPVNAQQNVAGNMFGGAPYTSFQGHFLVPVKAEVEQLPVAQLRDRVMEFVKVGRVNFDTMVFHTGSGELHRLGFYFNQHIMSIVVLNAMFNNSSQGDRAQFNQVCT